MFPCDNSLFEGPRASILTHFVNVLSTSFQVSFFKMSPHFWKHLELHLTSLFIKNGSVNKDLWTYPRAPREAASRARFPNKKQQLEHKMLLEFVSIARPMLELCAPTGFSSMLHVLGSHYAIHVLVQFVKNSCYIMRRPAASWANTIQHVFRQRSFLWSLPSFWTFPKPWTS